MLEGKRVQITDPVKLRIFYPGYRIIRELPLLSGKYIFVGDYFPLQRFPESIHVSSSGEVNLNKGEGVVALLESFKRVPQRIKDALLSLSLEDCWKEVEIFFFFGVAPRVERESSVFALFSALGKGKREVYKAYREVALPRAVPLSSLLTMILKAQSFTEFRGVVSPGYLRVLESVGRSLKDVRVKFLTYQMSEKTELDFIKLLFDLS